MVAVKREFELSHVFKDVSKLEDGNTFYGPEEEHFNVQWRIVLIHQKEDVAVFLRYLHPKNEQAPWKIDSEFTLKLSNSSGKSVTKTGSDIWNSYDALGFCDVFEWDSLLKDYLIDDVIIIEVAVKIKNMSGIPKKKLKSFERSNEEFSDVILAVGDKKFFVLRKFLASHSTYFETLLLGNFAEADKSEVKLQDINSTDFQNLMEVRYGEYAIDEETVDGILHLAHLYDMPFPIKRCEEFLVDSSEKSTKEKLKVAKKYQLENLKASCLAKINTLEEIKAALAGDLDEMDPSVVHALFRKSLALH
ncbi:BTB domain-containing protein [Caenorhabditis elegans]|uniref:BTB domain-containing protein n=1 Tax=Caenorhabditis elegans TaxID=6239 RepID=O44818_CAEEL|nr:BTB domain-containing protein [Caenorhabditis elegans]CCD67522.1 BTB domain-containing protein [Caenorhabditis elegans]|eukprot:NP_494125.2 BTB and MATH domain containing [Caenorhabditis elegans]